MRFLICCLSVLFVAACGHKQSSSPDPRTPASETRESHLTPEEVQALAKMIESKDEKAFGELLRKTAIAQSLIASFDDRLYNLSSKADSDRLMTSSLYCKVLNLRAIQESVDEKAIEAFELTTSRASDRAWVLSRMEAFAAQSPLNQAAMIQLLRTVRPSEQVFCGSANCLEKEISTLKFAVAPFDDQAFADFVSKNRKDIAKYSKPRSYDLNPGTCFKETRMPNQASTYDWKNRNWIGSVLPPGSFAITYDDGPHAQYTRGIANVWAQAGMAKPSFFWLTKQALKYPDIAKDLHNQGYIIGSHSDGHPDIGNLARAQSSRDLSAVNREFYRNQIPGITNFAAWKKQELNKQIPQAVATLGNIVGTKIRYFRLPYGSGVKNELVAQYFQAMDVDHFFWRVDSLDWQDKNPVSIRNRVVAQMNTVGKGIVLFHDIHPQSLKASELLVQYFKNNPRMRAVTLDSIPGLER